ncbi:hypothetical protein WJX72_004866 [[Myrmecia] bisecta]|uniref:Uncharacterized protein n=1 Tax=[Myrmecia] bisecta TaxID=41462 RepID=A0AAW1PYD2_9CHLO
MLSSSEENKPPPQHHQRYSSHNSAGVGPSSCGPQLHQYRHFTSLETGNVYSSVPTMECEETASETQRKPLSAAVRGNARRVLTPLNKQGTVNRQPPLDCEDSAVSLGRHSLHSRDSKHSTHSSRRLSSSPPPTLNSPAELPVINHSYIAAPAKTNTQPRKVDRVARFRQLQADWQRDQFLRAGGAAKTSQRRGENFNAQFAYAHALEQQTRDEYIRMYSRPPPGHNTTAVTPPTSKRRDALRWETRMRMQLRDEV